MTKSLDEYIREEDAKRVAAMNTPEALAEFEAVTARNREKAARELAAAPALTPVEEGREAFLRGDAIDSHDSGYGPAQVADFRYGWQDAESEEDE